MESFADEVKRTMSRGDWSGIPERDAVQFIACAIRDPDDIREYLSLGIGADEAFKIENEIN